MSFKNRLLSKASINDMLLKVIISTIISTTLLFGLIFYIYYSSNFQITDALKESFSVTASFFGGITTLAAAYVATKLFNDWKEQEEYNQNIQSVNRIINSCDNLIINLQSLIFPLSNLKSNSKFLFDNNITDEIVIKRVDDLAQEIFDKAMHSTLNYREMNTSMFRYMSFSNDNTIEEDAEALKLAHFEFTENFNLICDIDRLQQSNQAHEKLKLVLSIIRKLEHQLLPKLDKLLKINI